MNKKRILCFMISLAIGVLGVGAVEVYASDKEVETVWLGTPAHVWWETDFIGKWSSVKKAKEYQVKLYLADNLDWDEEGRKILDYEGEERECVMTRRVTDTECDFTGYVKDGHSYIFTVRATPRISEQAYVEAGEWAASKEMDFQEKTSVGISTGRWKDYIEGSKYIDGDGNELSDGWHLILGSWYLFDENGYRKKGWQTVDGKSYYLGENGRMKKGWFTVDGDWYFASDSGEVLTGWIMEQPGKYYYLDENGKMLHDCIIDGYFLDSDGLRKEG